MRKRLCLMEILSLFYELSEEHLAAGASPVDPLPALKDAAKLPTIETCE
jgi:hypothetical protein